MDKILSLIQNNYQEVVKRTAIYDKQLNVPLGTVSLTITISILVLFTLYFFSTCCRSSKPKTITVYSTKSNDNTTNISHPIHNETRKTLSKEAKNTILLMGPIDSGKTTMFHQVSKMILFMLFFEWILCYEKNIYYAVIEGIIEFYYF